MVDQILFVLGEIIIFHGIVISRVLIITPFVDTEQQYIYPVHSSRFS